MIKRISNTKMLQKLEELQSKVKNKTGIPVVLDLEQWLCSDDKTSSFSKYVSNYQAKNPNAQIIIDDMAVQTEMYIDTGLILDSDKETIKSFISLASDGNELPYMKSFISLFDKVCVIDEPPDYQDCLKWASCSREFNGERWLSDEEVATKNLKRSKQQFEDEIQIVREVFSELSTPFYLDFFDHYKVSSIEELIERYKDQRFFEKQSP